MTIDTAAALPRPFARDTRAQGTPQLSIICPFYNEEEVVDVFFERLVPILESTGLPYEVVCVNDGSRDGTQRRLLEQARTRRGVVVVELARNFGKEAALTAALDRARGEAVVPIDADLQDPPELIPRMVEAWRGGAEMVVARRADRSTDTWLKRTTSALFYRVHNAISDTPIPENVGDFRLMDRKVVEAIRQLPETRRFMKGLFAWAGFATTTIEYVRESRVAGKTKFSGWRLWNFAMEGFTSFSTAPLRIWFYVGCLVALISIVYATWIMVRTLVYGVAVPGYASIIVSVLFLGGIQLIGIGVLGEYVGRIYLESKRRPIYIVRSVSGSREGEA